MMKGKPMPIMTDSAAEIHHITNASVANLSPKAGTQLKTTILTIVLNPIGYVPKKRDWVGWCSMAVHIVGQTKYRILFVPSNDLGQFISRRVRWRIEVVNNMKG